MGTRQHCRDNLTMLSGHQSVGYCIMFLFFVATTPFRHRVQNKADVFYSLKLYMYIVTVLHYRCSGAKHLSHYRCSGGGAKHLLRYHCTVAEAELQ